MYHIVLHLRRSIVSWNSSWVFYILNIYVKYEKLEKQTQEIETENTGVSIKGYDSPRKEEETQMSGFNFKAKALVHHQKMSK